MNERRSDEVLTAFEVLLAAIEEEIDSINQAGARAQERRDYDAVRTAIERANQVTTLRDKVVTLRKEWDAFSATPKNRSGKQVTPTKRRNLGRLESGKLTAQTAFYHPILRALQDSGGSAKTNEVLKKVELFMKGTLQDVDYEPLPSKPFMLRWEETAQWARHNMVKEGLLKQHSPWGVWEITEAGRAALPKA